MAKKQDPKKLREEAAKLLETAKRIEEETTYKVGRYVLKLAAKGFDGVTVETLKTDVEKIIAGEV